MNLPRLTELRPAATSCHMQRIRQEEAWSNRRAWGAAAMLAAVLLATGGCISVNAPDKPIVIELNINIKQEVIYRLAADAGNTIESNPDIF
jgi:YnbE-like lipoprotein